MIRRRGRVYSVDIEEMVVLPQPLRELVFALALVRHDFDVLAFDDFGHADHFVDREMG